ncbi:MAG: rRNA pseudouridine synthase, partial [Chloroflexi bacterium]|nr:rRNA pseudouridine synthase [Chloroflexota bacterium]
VLDLIPTALIPDGTRLYPVGRLDLDSEGLLLLTNDGTWADHVLHPRFGVQREYAVGLEQALDHEQARALREGIRLDEGVATLAAPLRPATAVETRALVGLLDPVPPADLVWYRAVLAQGWKRQLRRMFAAVGAPIQRLVRVRIGTVRVDGIRTGRSRLLKAPEIRQLGAAPGAQASPTRASNPQLPARARSVVPGQRPGGPRRPKPKPKPGTGPGPRHQ